MRFDTIIIGGGFAGLAAATYLGRARRKVLVLDTGKTRNRFSPASHGFLGHDGRAPRDILAEAKQQLEAYPSVAIRQSAAMSAERIDGGFAVGLEDGERVSARRLILSYGLRDSLPQIPGLEKRWGVSVLHCPYCHGFEYGDRPLGVLYRNEMSLHQAQLITEWGPTTLFMNGNALPEEQGVQLAQAAVRVEYAPVAALVGKETKLSSLRLEDRRNVPLEALYLVPQSTHSSPLAGQLGLDIIETPMGPQIVTDETRMTTQAGIYAAGDIARAPHSISWAVADGVTAATAAHRSLVFE